MARDVTTKGISPRLAATAYHEAGHAVAHYIFRIPFRRATIESGEDYLGAVDRYRLSGVFLQRISAGLTTMKDRDRLERQVMCLMAGHIAEHRFRGRRNNAGSASDRDAIVDLLIRYCGPAEIQPYAKWLEVRARQILESPRWWPVVERVVAALLERTTLSADEVRSICVDAITKQAGAGPRRRVRDMSKSLSV